MRSVNLSIIFKFPGHTLIIDFVEGFTLAEFDVILPVQMIYHSSEVILRKILCVYKLYVILKQS